MIDRCLTQNRRLSLQAREAEQKLENNNQHAKIRILEGMIHFRLNNLNEAMEAYDNANKKLLGNSRITVELMGFLDYQLSRMAQHKEDHTEGINKLISSTEHYISVNNHQKALSNLFHILQYDMRNSTNLDVEEYLKKIESSSNKLKDKKEKNRNLAELSLYKALLGKNEKRKKNELFNAIKLFAKLDMYDKCTIATIELSKMELPSSLKNASKAAYEAIKYSEKSDSNIEMGRALLNLSIIKRMQNDYQDLDELEKKGYDFLTKEHSIEAAEILLDLSTTIIISSKSSLELFKAVIYAQLAFNIFNEMSIKIGKIASKIIEGITNEVSDSSDGPSKLSLSLITLKRSMKSQFNSNLNCDINYVMRILMGEMPVSDNLKIHYSELPLLTQSTLYQLLGIIRHTEDINEGLALMTRSNQLIEQLVQKNKEFQVILDVNRERVSKYF